MSGELNPLLKENCPTHVGTMRKNHDDCGDSRRRLFITRTTKNLVIGYCHNCGKDGAIPVGICVKLLDTDIAPMAPHKNIAYDVEEYLQSLPECGLPPHARRWIKEAFFENYNDTELYNYFGICWDDIRGGLVIPRYQDNKVTHFQWRFFNGGFKYQTQLGGNYDLLAIRAVEYKGQGDAGSFLPVQPWPSKKVTSAVIVEDILSAYRISRESGGWLHGICLEGSHFPMERAMKIAKRYATIAVWLDNDSEIIESAAESVMTKLRLVGAKDVHLVTLEKEPKKLHPDELYSKLCNLNMKGSIDSE